MSEKEARELGLYTRVSEMEPLLVESGALEDLAAAILEGSAALSAILPEQTLSGLREMLRIVNSYYSNLIEGNSTHPIDIERATRKDYSGDPAKRNRQLESVAHIECQRAIDARLAAEPEVAITSPEWLCWVHRSFYDRLPDELRQVKDEETGETLAVVGGELRERDVRVARHVGPPSAYMPRFLDRYHEVYGRRMHGIHPIIATAAAHHRLMWIHPFLDGNGRVARLCSDASFRKLLKGYSVWNVSRGLARRRADYYAALAHADARRKGDLDGRGDLSQKGLEEFVAFFLETCLDQIEYMRSVLRVDGLLDRLHGYVTLRQLGMAPCPPDAQKLRPEAAHLLQEALVRGEVARGDVGRITGLGDRLGRTLVASLVKERLLVTPMPQGGLRPGFPPHAVEYYFPGLFPPTGGVA